MPQRGAGCLNRLRHDDAGFSLLEAIVAAVVLLIFASAVSVLLTTSLRASQLDRQRVAASSLAEREMEIVRDTFGKSDGSALTIVNAGLVTNPDPVGASGPSVVNGTPFNVVRDATWVPNGTGQSACDGGGQVTYPGVKVTVTVTWPNMGSVKPVTSESLLTPTKKLLQNTTVSFMAVKVVNYAQQPNPGRTVNASSSSGGATSQQTDTYGCAVFGLTTSGTWTFSLGDAGYVDSTGNPNPRYSQSVAGGAFYQHTFTYDQAGSLQVSYATRSGYPLPVSPLPALNIANSGMPTSINFPGQHSANYASTGSSTTINNLGPYPGGYAVYSGGCADSNPAGSPTVGGALTPVTLVQGSVVSVTAPLAPIDVQVNSFTGLLRGGLAVTATSASSCISGQSALNLGATDGSGHLMVSMPYGNWTISVTGPIGVLGTSSVFHPNWSAGTTVTVNTA